MGFLPYRGDGWPQGVQEEEPVPWSWSSAVDPTLPRGNAGADLDGPELIEIAGGTAVAASPIDAARLVGGRATRLR